MTTQPRNVARLRYYVRFDTNDYSVDPTALSQIVDVAALTRGTAMASRAHLDVAGWR